MEIKSKCKEKLHNPSSVYKIAQRHVKLAKIRLQAIQKQKHKQACMHNINSEEQNKQLWRDEEQKKSFLNALINSISQGDDDAKKIEAMNCMITSHQERFQSLMEKDLSGCRSKYLDYVSEHISKYGVKLCLAFEMEVAKHCGETSLIHDWDA